jgi:hypothetical protein
VPSGDAFSSAASTAGCMEPRILVTSRCLISARSGLGQKETREGGEWIYKVKGFIDPVPYKKPQLLNAIRCARHIFLVEGERKVDRLCALGLGRRCVTPD